MTLDVSPLAGAFYGPDNVAAVTTIDVTNGGTFTITSGEWPGSLADNNPLDPSLSVQAVSTSFITPADEAAGFVNFTLDLGDGSTPAFYGLVLGFDPTDDAYLVQPYTSYFGPGDPHNVIQPNHYEVFSGDNSNTGTVLSGFDGHIDQGQPPPSDAPFLPMTFFADGVACYCAGTGILTERGEIPVERLRVGDRVVTLGGGGGVRSVTWIGHTAIEVGRHPRPMQVAPVRIRAGAIGPDMPHRDLLVSPEHAIGLRDTDGHSVLVPAVYLVNGATILREPVTGTVRYFHVELDRHELLLADGLPAESYLDTGNRGLFANAAASRVLHPDLQPRAWEVDGCAPLLLGSDAAPLHQGLLERAHVLGHALTSEPDLVVEATGQAVAPVWRHCGKHVYLLPRGVTAVRLLSRVTVPNDLDPGNDERRQLGVALTGLRLDGAEIALESEMFGEGFLPTERVDGSAWRWTTGAAVLALPATPERMVLEVALHQDWLRYWITAPFAMAARRGA